MVNEDDENEGKIVFTYERSDQYREFHASGAYGGIQPRGEFKIDFFTEKYPVPDQRMMDKETGEWLGSRSKGSKIVRELQTGVLMDTKNAFSLATWIIAHIFELPIEKVESDILKNYNESNNIEE